MTDGHPHAEVVNEDYAEYNAGEGMHVTLSPTGPHNLCVAPRSDFRSEVTSPIPSGNVDIVPTLLWLMDIKPAVPLDGRVLGEVPAVHGVEHGRRDADAELPGGNWKQFLKFTEVNSVRYLEEGNGTWTPHGEAVKH